MINLTLTKSEQAVLLGTLLGDGHLQKRNNSYRLKIQHCFKNKDYVWWKYNALKRLCHENTLPKLVKSQTNDYYYFFLKSGSYLEIYHHLFYKPYLWQPSSSDKNVKENDRQPKIRYRKSITQELIRFLPCDPLILAVWFMDDGHCRTDSFSGKLGTYAFLKEEQWLLQEYISKFTIKTNIVLQNRIKKQYYLTITGRNKNFDRFVDIIKPFVQEIPSMIYKIRNLKIK